MRDKLVGTYVDRGTYEGIRKAAYEERTSQSGVVRRAIEEYLMKRAKGKGSKP